MLIVCILLPLLGGALLPLCRFPERSRLRGIVTEAVVCLTSVLIAVALIRGIPLEFTLWEVFPGAVISFRCDGMSSVFLGLIAFLWPLASLYGFSYMEHEHRPNAFFAWYTICYGITICVASAGNLFTMYFAFESLTLITLPLVWHKWNEESVAAARKYALFVLGAAALGFLALVSLTALGGGSFSPGGAIPAETRAEHGDLLRWLYVLAFLGFGVKAAVLPFSSWLPTASAAPTPVTALLHAVAVVNAGAFCVARVTWFAFGTEMLIGTWAQTAVLLIACCTVVLCSAMAVKENHLKRRLAWSTASNLSYILVGITLMTGEGLTGALSHLVIHGLMKIVLFFAAGAILVRSGKEYVTEVRGFARTMPFVCACFTVCAVALVGIPPLSGFVSKWILLEAAVHTGTSSGIFAGACLIVSSILTAVYLLSVVTAFYFRPLSEENRAWGAEPRDPDLRMKLPMAVISALVVILGFWSEPLVTFFRSLVP